MTSVGFAEHLFRTALAELDIRTRMAETVKCIDGRLVIEQHIYKLSDYRRVGVIALGKAACPMAYSLLEQVSGLKLSSPITGLVVSAAIPDVRSPDLTYLTGGHPLPTAESRVAAEAVLEFLSDFGSGDLVIFLISGGASAMLEKPLRDDITIEDTTAFYKALVHSGLSIMQINCLRKRVSAVKGGRLALAAAGADQISLIVSDVPNDDLSMVSSGPSLPDTCSPAKLRNLLRSTSLLMDIPESVRRLLDSTQLPEPPRATDEAFRKSCVVCLFSERELAEVTARIARSHGYKAVVDNTPDDWEYSEAAEYLLNRLHSLAAENPKLCLISVGELSIPLKEPIGTGGRNQHFALECALRLPIFSADATVLSAGTDGVDGNSPAAGAVVTRHTYEQAIAMELSPEKASAAFDSFPFFQQLGLSIMTGPTENNLRDLRILLSN